MRKLHGAGCSLAKECCEQAALYGHLEVLKWARANGCEWDALTCASAAHGGHLEVLKWARANGCEWDALTCARCLEVAKDVAIKQWIIEHLQKRFKMK